MTVKVNQLRKDTANIIQIAIRGLRMAPGTYVLLPPDVPLDKEPVSTDVCSELSGLI